MRKICIWLLVTTISVFFLAGCNAKDIPTNPPSATTQDEQTQPESIPVEVETQEVSMQENPVGHEDTYWVASQWYGDDGERTEGPQSLPTDSWYLDLIIRVNGTAQFRDIHEGVCLMDDSYLNLVWERTPEGELLFYTVLYPEPVLRGTCESGVLSLEYWGTTLTMQQEAMPQTIGQMYTPAELAGTWLLVSGETEGYQWEAMPNELSSIVFQVTAYDGPLVLSADIEERDYYGNLQDSSYGQIVEVVKLPLYEGCENEAWSVRIGNTSALDANGFPLETEFYATLLGEDKLLLQRWYTLDGYPAVSYQTYLRFPDLVSWMSPESMNLNYSNWVCTGYEDTSGEELPLPPELDGFSIVLGPDQDCYLYYGDGSMQDGTWTLGNGGVLLMRGAETLEEPFWFGGAISGYWVETTDESIETYQMALYYNGGILKLAMNGYG